MRISRLVLIVGVVFGLNACGGCDDPPDKNSADQDAGIDGSTDEGPSNNSCEPRSPEELCEAVNAMCGVLDVDDDGCGNDVLVQCGSCGSQEACTNNQCVCAGESDEELCSAQMKDCGELTLVDRCAENRTVDCGTCTDPEDCGAGGTDNVCGCPCDIDGTCVPEGATNPDNGCELCDPAQSTTAWSLQPAGEACDDGISCTTSSVCDQAGACVGGVPEEGFCLIDDETCVTSGETDPENPCLQCEPATDPLGWAPYDDVPCSDGDGFDCTGVCQSGACTNAPRPDTCLIDGTCYTDGDENPGATCEQCRADVDATDWSQALVGSPCDDGLACTPDSACGEFGDCEPGPPTQGNCAIDGACWNDGDANPAEPCQVCDASSPLQWAGVAAGTTCDDGLVCTGGDQCDGNGNCVGSTDAGFCAVDGACYADGTVNPLNPCEVCDPTTATNAWSFVAQGDVCDEGLACASAGTCDGAGTCIPTTIDDGSCLIDSTCYLDGTANPDDACGFCDPTADQTAWSNNDGATCEDGDQLACTGVCFAGTCQSRARVDSCALDGACWNDGDINPANPCQMCDTTTPEQWSGTAQGTVCDDGLSCTGNDACDGAGQCIGDIDATCAIDGTCYPDGAVNPNNPCQACDPDRDQTSWTPLDAGTTCDDGLGCTANETCNGQHKCVGDLVADYCLIRGTCYGEGTDRPDVADCQFCDSALDPYGWSLQPVGTTCDDGLACTGDGTCNMGGRCRDGQPVVASTCAIDGACWMDGDANPLNNCEVCDSTVDATAWSPNQAGTVCSDGLTCTTADACDDTGTCIGTLSQDRCNIDGQCWVDGAANPSNTCEFCDADVDPTTWALLPAGTVCDDGLGCTSNAICSATGSCDGTIDAGSCMIDDACFGDGDANPDNECQVCDPATSLIDWTNAADDSVCGPNDTAVCCAGACQAMCP